MTLLLLRPLVVVVEEEAPGLDRPDTESLPAEDRGCAVASCSDTLGGLISQFSLSSLYLPEQRRLVDSSWRNDKSQDKKRRPEISVCRPRCGYARKKEAEKKETRVAQKRKSPPPNLRAYRYGALVEPVLGVILFIEGRERRTENKVAEGGSGRRKRGRLDKEKRNAMKIFLGPGGSRERRVEVVLVAVVVVGVVAGRPGKNK